MIWHEVWSGITATSFTQIGEMGGPLKESRHNFAGLRAGMRSKNLGTGRELLEGTYIRGNRKEIPGTHL
jgi:hypothetical protein